MNILFFSRLFYPHIGGVEKHVLEVSRLLIAKGNRVTVVTEQNYPELKLNERIEGIEIFRISNLKNGRFKKFQIWLWFFKNINLIKNSDIIHCHDVFFWYLPFKILFPNKKVYTTFHGYEGYPLKKKDILVHKISEKLSTGNICIGDFIKKWYRTKSTYVSYGGVKILDIENQKSKIKNKNSALFIGRLDEQTGILAYVKAVEIIRKKVPDFTLDIIGDGKFRKQIEKDFKVLGFQKNSEKHFAKYLFAFVPGYLSILEAMAAKRLVFAVYDNPLKGDYLKMAPFSKFITISNSSSELVSKIIFYLDNIKKQEQITESAYEWVKNQTWEKVVNTYSKLWEL